jgi:hypothetical protein
MRAPHGEDLNGLLKAVDSVVKVVMSRLKQYAANAAKR